MRKKESTLKKLRTLQQAYKAQEGQVKYWKEAADELLKQTGHLSGQNKQLEKENQSSLVRAEHADQELKIQSNAFHNERKFLQNEVTRLYQSRARALHVVGEQAENQTLKFVCGEQQQAIISIDGINTETKEGRMLMAALAKISVESQRDKQPDEILKQVQQLADSMYTVPLSNSNKKLKIKFIKRA